jgi:hypothetical protein
VLQLAFPLYAPAVRVIPIVLVFVGALGVAGMLFAPKNRRWWGWLGLLAGSGVSVGASKFAVRSAYRLLAGNDMQAWHDLEAKLMLMVPLAEVIAAAASVVVCALSILVVRACVEARLNDRPLPQRSERQTDPEE